MFNAQQITSKLQMVPDQALQQLAMQHRDDPMLLPLIIAEDGRRKQIRASAQMGQQAQTPPQPQTIVDQAVSQIGAMPDIPNQAPQMNPQLQQGIAAVQQRQQLTQPPKPSGMNAQSPQRNFARGGIVSLAEGGEVQYERLIDAFIKQGYPPALAEQKASAALQQVQAPSVRTRIPAMERPPVQPAAMAAATTRLPSDVRKYGPNNTSNARPQEWEGSVGQPSWEGSTRPQAAVGRTPWSQRSRPTVDDIIPGLKNTVMTAVDDARRAADRGNYAGAFGNVVRGAVTAPVALADDAVRGMGPGIMSFFKGVTGGGDDDAPASAATPRNAPPTSAAAYPDEIARGDRRGVAPAVAAARAAPRGGSGGGGGGRSRGDIADVAAAVQIPEKMGKFDIKPEIDFVSQAAAAAAAPVRRKDPPPNTDKQRPGYSNDDWLQFGLRMLGSKSPRFAGALSEAGLGALENKSAREKAAMERRKDESSMRLQDAQIENYGKEPEAVRTAQWMYGSPEAARAAQREKDMPAELRTLKAIAADPSLLETMRRAKDAGTATPDQIRALEIMQQKPELFKLFMRIEQVKNQRDHGPNRDMQLLEYLKNPQNMAHFERMQGAKKTSGMTEKDWIKEYNDDPMKLIWDKKGGYQAWKAQYGGGGGNMPNDGFGATVKTR